MGPPAGERRARRVLAMVGELHKRGYQRLRVSPGTSGSGMHWRCQFAPVDTVRRDHGALVLGIDDGDFALYSSGQGNHYFGWADAERATTRQLATLFLERFPILSRRGQGWDWPYAGWYVQVLGLADEGYFPIAYYNDGYEVPDGLLAWQWSGGDERRLPLPPAGSGR